MIAAVKSYILRDIPDDVWRQVKSTAALEGITVRELILRAIKAINATKPINMDT